METRIIREYVRATSALNRACAGLAGKDLAVLLHAGVILRLRVSTEAVSGGTGKEGGGSRSRLRARGR